MPSIIVVGSGVAGMTAALEAVGSYDVTLLTKATLAQSNTRLSLIHISEPTRPY